MKAERPTLCHSERSPRSEESTRSGSLSLQDGNHGSVLAPDPGRILTGDCVDLMRGWPAGFADACITDPPYNMSRRKGLGGAFSSHVTMQEDWDRFSEDGDIEFTRQWLSQ